MRLWIKRFYNIILNIISYPDVFIQKIRLSIINLKTKYLKEDDLYDLLNLIRLDISPEDALKIIRNSHNKENIDMIIRNLSTGKDFNEVFSICLKEKDRKHFKIFNKYLSFEKSLSLTLELNKLRKDLFKNLISEMLYPLVLMFISLIGIYVFIYLAYPGITAVLCGFNYDFTIMDNIVLLVKVIINLIFIIIFILLILIIYSRVMNNKTLLFIVLCRVKKNNFYQKYISNVFIRYFNECVKTGLKTKNILNLLSEISDPLIVLEAYHIDYSLNEGNKLISAVDNDFLDERMLRFFNMASYSENLDEILDRYIRFSDESFKRCCKQYSRSIMIVSYLIIALMIVFIYQILFIPLEVLSEL